MARLTLLLSILLLCAAKPVGAQWTASGPDVPELAAFDAAMHDFMAARNIPSGQLAVTWQGRLVLARGYTRNPGALDIVVQPDSLFRLASVSKPIVSTLVHRLVQDGQLDLNQTVGSLVDLSPLPGYSADPRLATVTVRDLLEHLGGFDGWPQPNRDPMFADASHAQANGVPLPIGRQHIIRTLGGLPLVAEPGSTYRYSNYGYMLLGQVIEAAAGMSIRDYADSLFQTIGVWDIRPARSDLAGRHPGEVFYQSGVSTTTVLDPSGVQVPWEYGGMNMDNLLAAGGWLASAVELARWLANLDDPTAAGALLNADSQALMFGLPQNFPLPYTPGNAYYGSGWLVRDFGAAGRTTWHTGSLPSTSAVVVRYYNGFSFVALLNRRNESDVGAYNSQIQTAIFAAYNQIGAWPAHDLFPTQLPVVFRAGFD